MIRPFVVEELKQTLLPGIALAGAAAILVLLAKPLLSRLVTNPLDARGAMSVLVSAMLIVVASSGGAAAFALPFRQGPLRLLENMPISRPRIWGVRVLVSLLTTVSSAGLLIAAHVDVLDQSRETIVAALAVAGIVFTAGLCYGMLVQAGTAILVVLNVILSFPVMAFLVFLAFLASSSGASGAQFFAVASIPVCVVNLIFSGSVFLRGEFDVWRHRVLNNLALIAVLITTALTLTLATDFGTFAVADDWVIVPRTRTSVSWSPDGRYLSLILQKGEHQSITKAVVIDVDVGAIVKTFRENSLQESLWTPDGTLLVVSEGTVLKKVLGTGGGTVRVTRIFPSEESLFSRNRSRLVRMLQSNQAGVILVLNSHFPFKRWEGVTAVIRLDPPGSFQEILTRPWRIAYPAWAWRYEDHILFAEDVGVGADWLIGKDIRRLGPQWGPFVFQDETARKAHQTSLRRTMPGRTDDAQSRGVFVWSDSDLLPCDQNCWVYFLNIDRSTPRGTLFARRNGDDSWKPVFSNVSMTAAQMNQATRTPGGYSPASGFNLWTGLRSGVALNIYRSGTKSMISLANLVTGERFDFEDTNLYPTGHSQEVRAEVGESSIEIIPYRVPQGRMAVPQPIHYAYQPGSGLAAPIQRGRRQPGPLKTAVNFSSPKGTGVIINPDKIIARSPDGATRQLWPQ